jgi:hypothetical protein
MKKSLVKLFEALALLMGANCSTRKQSVIDGLCDYSGQGRDIFGN